MPTAKKTTSRKTATRKTPVKCEPESEVVHNNEVEEQAEERVNPILHGYIVVIFDRNGSPRGAGYSPTHDGAVDIINKSIQPTDSRAHIYPLPHTQDNIYVYKYKG